MKTILLTFVLVPFTMISEPDTSVNPACSTDGDSQSIGDSLRHSPRSLAANPLIVAHRGASRDAPENTIPAFELAWKQNSDAIEGDFHLTQDNQIVCIHNHSTGAYTDRDLDVSETSLEVLRKLDVGKRHHPKFAGTRIPTIAEVLATVPKSKKIYVEIKCGTEILPFLEPELENSKLTNSQIVIISFSAEVIREAKKRFPDLKCCWLSGFKEKDGMITPTQEQIITQLKRTNADGFSSHFEKIDRETIKAVKQAGYEYHVWTVDDPRVAARFQKWEADSITTNVPQRILKQLRISSQ